MRLRAVLAAGVALGLGVGSTVASWSDAELGVGVFAASRFVVQSNTQNAGWVDAPTAPGTSISAGLGGMLPGSSVYFQVQLRGSTGSVAGRTTLVGASIGAATPAAVTFASELRYRVVRTTGTCGATAFTGTPIYVVGNGAATPVRRELTVGQEVGVINPVLAATPTTPGDETGYCFEVLLPTTSVSSSQGQSITATWRFQSVSL